MEPISYSSEPVSPPKTEVPKTMEEFVEQLKRSPVETYRTLLYLVKEQGTDFAFPPYSETLKNIAEYLIRRPDYQMLIDFRRRIEKEMNAPHYTTASNLIAEFVHTFPYHSKDDRITDPRLSSTRDPISFREEDQMVVFQFACDVDLDADYYIDVRPVPVFALGLGGGPYFDPPAFDLYYSSVGRSAFYNHDEQHTSLMQNMESKKSLTDVPSNRLRSIVKKCLPDHPYKLIEYAALSKKISYFVNQLPDENRKKACKALLFSLCHEDEGGGYNFDPDFINRKALLDQALNNFFHGIEPDEAQIENSINLGKGLKDAIERNATTLKQRLKGNFAYPDEYKTKDVIDEIPIASRLIFNILNEHRSMPKGKPSALQIAIDREVSEAAKMILKSRM